MQPKPFTGDGAKMKPTLQLCMLILLGAIMLAPPDLGAAAPANSIVGSWTAEQVNPDGSAPVQATLTFARTSAGLTGRMRMGNEDRPLFQVEERALSVSFTLVIPGTPYISVHYFGAHTGDELRLVSLEEGHGVFTMTAHRIAAPAPPPPPAPAQPSLSPPPPQVAAAPPLPAQTQAAPLQPLLPAGPASPATPAPPRAAERAPAGNLEGRWTAEEMSPNAASGQAMLVFTRNRGALSGVLRMGTEETPLFEIRQSGDAVSFTRVIPGAPYVTVNYSGTLKGDALALSSGDNAYRLTAHRAGTSPMPAPARVAAALQPAPAPAPQLALLNPPPPPAPRAPVQAPAAATPLPPQPPAAIAPPQPTGPRQAIPNAMATGQLDGAWTAEQASPGSAAPIQASLAFTGNRGVMHVGADDWPLFDVRDAGPDVAFTLVIPGTPYITIHYGGMIESNALRLASLDEGQGVFRLTARRAAPPTRPIVAAALPAPPPPAPAVQSEPRVALLNPPPAPPRPQAPSIPPPAAPAPAPAAPAQLPNFALLNPPAAPPPARPPAAASQPPVAAAPSGPPPKPPLPPLRELPPNNLAKTPLMGWASRGKLTAELEDNAIRQAAESLDETGLRAAGFVYVEVDEGWQGTRDANGVLHGNAKFPDMKALGDYIHSKRLKFGLQISAGPKSCGGFEGSYGHEEQDAKTFASWGVDYLVYDWCGAENIYMTQAEQQAAYQKMGEALRASGRDIVFGMSQNGAFNVASWGAKTGANLWRTGRSIEDNWQSMSEAGFGQNGKEAYAGPGQWNDPGLIQVGNGGMTPDEYRTQLNLWAVLAAPMMLGNEVRIMTRETLATLSNPEVIAIDQDPLGRQAKRVSQNGESEVWARPLVDGSMAVAFFNRGDQSAPVAVSWQQLGIDGPRRVRDLWWHENIGTANGRYVVFLTGHTSLLLRISR